jgi:hypothetical protein
MCKRDQLDTRYSDSDSDSDTSTELAISATAGGEGSAFEKRDSEFDDADPNKALVAEFIKRWSSVYQLIAQDEASASPCKSFPPEGSVSRKRELELLAALAPACEGRHGNLFARPSFSWLTRDVAPLAKVMKGYSRTDVTRLVGLIDYLGLPTSLVAIVKNIDTVIALEEAKAKHREALAKHDKATATEPEPRLEDFLVLDPYGTAFIEAATAELPVLFQTCSPVFVGDKGPFWYWHPTAPERQAFVDGAMGRGLDPTYLNLSKQMMAYSEACLIIHKRLPFSLEAALKRGADALWLYALCATRLGKQEALEEQQTVQDLTKQVPELASTAVEYGHLHVLQWLQHTFPSCFTEVVATASDSFSSAPSLAFLPRVLHIDIDADPRNELERVMCSPGFEDNVDRLVTEAARLFPSGPSRIPTPLVTKLFRRAAFSGHTRSTAWLRTLPSFLKYAVFLHDRRGLAGPLKAAVEGRQQGSVRCLLENDREEIRPPTHFGPLATVDLRPDPGTPDSFTDELLVSPSPEFMRLLELNFHISGAYLEPIQRLDIQLVSYLVKRRYRLELEDDYQARAAVATLVEGGQRCLPILRILIESSVLSLSEPFTDLETHEFATTGLLLCRAAARGGSVSVLQYLRKQGCESDDSLLLEAAIGNQVPMLAHLKTENPHWLWPEHIVEKAEEAGADAAVAWLLQKGAPPSLPAATAGEVPADGATSASVEGWTNTIRTAWEAFARRSR